MRFSFNTEQLELRDAVRDLLRRECPPETLREAWTNDSGRAPKAWAALAEMGALAVMTPEANGGLGLNEIDAVLIAQEAGYVALPEPIVDTMLVAAPWALVDGDESAVVLVPENPLTAWADSASAVITLAVLWLDVDTTGASPSAVRAFLLVACSEAAFVLRRPSHGLSSLATAALIVLLVDPMALFSASFQMSYGVVLAIICFGLPLTERMESRWVPFKRLPAATWAWWQRALAGGWHKVAGALGLGAAAALVGTLSGAAFYHTFSPGALPTNLLLVPPAMAVIIAGFASVAVGLAGFASGSSLFNHAAVLLIWGIEAIIRLGLLIPGTWWTATWRAPWAASLALATLLAVFLAGYATGWRRAYGGFWPPVVFVVVMMAIGMKFG